MNCPNCKNLFQQDFGLVTCPTCGHVFLVDIDMNLIQAEKPHKSELESKPKPKPKSEQEPESELELEPEFKVALEAIPEPILEPIQEPIPDSRPEPEFKLESDFDTQPVFESSKLKNDLLASDLKKTTLNFDDVLEYGNDLSETSQLLYNLIIKDIETNDSYKKLTETLSDPALKLDYEELLKRINQGCLLIEKINPIKAHVIIKKLKKENLTISWSQDVLK